MRIHIARFGDTLSDLAIRYQLSEEKILHANPHLEDPADLTPGSKVRIPTGRVVVEKKTHDETESKPTEEITNESIEILPTYVFPLELDLTEWVEGDFETEGREEEDDWQEESTDYEIESYQVESSSSSSEEGLSAYPFVPYYPANFAYPSAYSFDPDYWAQSAFFPPAEPCNCSEDSQVSYYPEFQSFQPPMTYSTPVDFPTEVFRRADLSAEF
ncbi:LysM peptidoglycan-binding domain-containing protein [Risungbinella massiliensis]|uniref:LysM peptidoglycan-binding domain-containing protein n=1 Tax=Risungbinella massiliensis TaxID=1329796 RepID=UPI0005CB8188|nr:LysM peptidoglycan-binding domain-containing protein [Risungbinella massiliensis]